MKKTILLSLISSLAFASPESCNPSSLYYEETSKLYNDTMIEINCFNKNIRIRENEINLSSLKNPLMTPLKIAIYKKNYKITKELLEKGAKVKTSDIIVAVRNEDIKTVKLLHKYYPNVFFESINGINALRHAYYKNQYKNNKEMIDLLKSYNLELKPNFFKEEELGDIELEVFDRNLIRYKATSMKEISKYADVEGYRIMDDKDGLYSIYFKDNNCFLFKQSITGKGGEIPYKKLKNKECKDIFMNIQRLNFWGSKLKREHWITGKPMLLEGIRSGEYKTYIYWENNKNEIDVKRILNMIKDVIYK